MEKDSSNSGWTYETLKEHLLSIIELNDRRYTERGESVQRALDKAEATMNQRLNGMNEFRDTLRDQAGTFVSRSDLAGLEKATDVRLKILENKNANLEGRLWAIGAGITIINLAIAIAAFVINASR